MNKYSVTFKGTIGSSSRLHDLYRVEFDALNDVIAEGAVQTLHPNFPRGEAVCTIYHLERVE